MVHISLTHWLFAQVTYALVLCIRSHIVYTLLVGGFFGGAIFIIGPLYMVEISVNR